MLLDAIDMPYATENQVLKEPRADPNKWCQPGKDHGGMAEVLFNALLLCITHVGRVEALKSWQTKVLAEEFVATELKELWKPADHWQWDARGAGMQRVLTSSRAKKNGKCFVFYGMLEGCTACEA